MKITALNIMIPLVILSLAFFVVPRAFASIDVNISNNGEESSNKVNVKSSGTTTINGKTVTNGSSKTTIKINNNGQEKTFESNGEDISYQSEDGSTKVQVKGSGTKAEVNNNSSSATSYDDNNDKEEMEKKKAEAEKKVMEAKKRIAEKRFNFFEFLREKFASFFSFTSHAEK